VVVLFKFPAHRHCTTFNKGAKMKKQLQSHISSSDEPSHTNVLANWIITVDTFQGHYNQLANLVAACQHQQPFIKASACLGQCSVQELTNLLDKMTQQLEILLLDMNQSSYKATQKNNQRLVSHTRVLDELNTQAQKLLVLTLLSAS